MDGSGEIREEFWGFLHCELGLSGKALAETVLNGIANLTLDIQNCRGQGYDGASSVSGYINGLPAQILRINEKAIYTHCHSHRLNLIVAASCNIRIDRNVLDQIKELSHFLNYAEPRQKIFDACVENYAPNSSKKKLKDVCHTRWVERITGLDDLEELFIPIVCCLEQMSLNVRVSHMGSTGGGDNLGKIAKNCIKMTKSAFLGQNSWGDMGEGQARVTPQSPPH